MNKRDILLSITSLLLLLFFTSCSDSNTKKNMNIQNKNTLTIAFASWPGFDIIYYAQIKNLFKEYDLNVKIIKYQDQEAATKALQNLEVDAAMTSIFDAIHLQGDKQFNIILSTNVSSGADGLVAQRAISSVEDLKGKTISAQKGTVNELILFEALEMHHMSFKDVNIIDITNDEALPRLFHHHLDAAVIWEPLLSKTKNKIDGNILFTTKDIDSSVIDLLIVQKASFDKKRKDWRKFLFAWFDLMKKLRTNQNEVMSVVEEKTFNPNFSRDYVGLKAGTIQLNKKLFLDGKLQNAIEKINTLVTVDKQASLVLKTEFLKDSILEWEKSQN